MIRREKHVFKIIPENISTFSSFFIFATLKKFKDYLCSDNPTSEIKVHSARVLSFRGYDVNKVTNFIFITIKLLLFNSNAGSAVSTQKFPF